MPRTSAPIVLVKGMSLTDMVSAESLAYGGYNLTRFLCGTNQDAIVGEDRTEEKHCLEQFMHETVKEGRKAIGTRVLIDSRTVLSSGANTVFREGAH